MLMPLVKRLSKWRPIAPALRASAGGAFSSGARKSPAVPSSARSETGSTATTDSVTCGAMGRETERLKRLCSEPPAGVGNLMPVSPAGPWMRTFLPPATCSSTSFALPREPSAVVLNRVWSEWPSELTALAVSRYFFGVSLRTDSAAGHLLGSVAVGSPEVPARPALKPR